MKLLKVYRVVPGVQCLGRENFFSVSGLTKTVNAESLYCFCCMDLQSWVLTVVWMPFRGESIFKVQCSKYGLQSLIYLKRLCFEICNRRWGGVLFFCLDLMICWRKGQKGKLQAG